MAGGLNKRYKKGERPEDIDRALKKEKVREWLHEQLFIAFVEARCAKRGTADEHMFELNALENIHQLLEDILNRAYKPSRGIAFVIKIPVVREIFAAPFRDRLVHHFLFNMTAEWWDRRFIHTSSSCRKGKGTLFAVQQLEKQVQAITQNYKRKASVIKLDIQWYFMSLPRRKLYERILWGLNQQFPEHGEVYKLCRYLWREIIFDDPTKDVKRRGSRADWYLLESLKKSLFAQPRGRGIVIGNLSSQLLSNIYLDQLDHYVMEELGYKYYGRYVDDFYILVTEEEYKQALIDVEAIERFLELLGLTLHPKKRYIQPVSHGIPFLGAVVYPGRKVPARRIKNNFYKTFYRLKTGKPVDLASLVSYMGHLEHLDSIRLKQKVFAMVGLKYEPQRTYNPDAFRGQLIQHGLLKADSPGCDGRSRREKEQLPGNTANS